MVKIELFQMWKGQENSLISNSAILDKKLVTLLLKIITFAESFCPAQKNFSFSLLLFG